MTDKCFI